MPAGAWSLDPATESDVDELMRWFPDAATVDIWGGPRFRYPFDRVSFHEDCRWHEFSSYSLRNPHRVLAAFGQIGDRYDKAHLARLVVHPGMRGEGAGRRLVEGLVGAAKREERFEKVGLFVYRHNQPAYRCYLACGFEVQSYPPDAPMEDLCYYMTRHLT